MDKRNANLVLNYGDDAHNGFQPTESLHDRVAPCKRKVVLESDSDQYTHMFKTVEIEVPDEHWHVVGEVAE